jgi:hypothetical protein
MAVRPATSTQKKAMMISYFAWFGKLGGKERMFCCLTIISQGEGGFKSEVQQGYGASVAAS